MGKIYDCFNFFNELDILEIRLNTLYDYVDFFVIVESSVTHSGEEKPFYFEKNLFPKYNIKINDVSEINNINKDTKAISGILF